jgi:hypothetical protein
MDSLLMRWLMFGSVLRSSTGRFSLRSLCEWLRYHELLKHCVMATNVRSQMKLEYYKKAYQIPHLKVNSGKINFYNSVVLPTTWEKNVGSLAREADRADSTGIRNPELNHSPALGVRSRHLRFQEIIGSSNMMTFVYSIKYITHYGHNSHSYLSTTHKWVKDLFENY